MSSLMFIDGIVSVSPKYEDLFKEFLLRNGWNFHKQNREDYEIYFDGDMDDDELEHEMNEFASVCHVTGVLSVVNGEEGPSANHYQYDLRNGKATFLYGNTFVLYDDPEGSTDNLEEFVGTLPYYVIEYIKRTR